MMLSPEGTNDVLAGRSSHRSVELSHYFCWSIVDDGSSWCQAIPGTLGRAVREATTLRAMIHSAYCSWRPSGVCLFEAGNPATAASSVIHSSSFFSPSPVQISSPPVQDEPHQDYRAHRHHCCYHGLAHGGWQILQQTSISGDDSYTTTSTTTPTVTPAVPTSNPVVTPTTTPTATMGWASTKSIHGASGGIGAGVSGSANGGVSGGFGAGVSGSANGGVSGGIGAGVSGKVGLSTRNVYWNETFSTTYNKKNEKTSTGKKSSTKTSTKSSAKTVQAGKSAEGGSWFTTNWWKPGFRSTSSTSKTPCPKSSTSGQSTKQSTKQSLRQ
ncbi:unnamed protein product [Phytophthora lilii]|uniref:Unnamed protein product n=1 Tax=Phytophthora lilii TaxID=2077276 RepID=A0A9W6TP06_9STRA|nr:unnamed protein product [Phytophthora lilii]